VDREEALRRLAQARVARLATADASGQPHVVPFVFALEGSTIYWAVDDKPKRSRDLKRVANIRANPRVEVVVDQYEDDWRELWWVRASGTARIVAGVEAARAATTALAAKYPPYDEHPPPGPFVAIEILRVTWWSANTAP
jgi:PPOX class probable F420-dependent enzyme